MLDNKEIMELVRKSVEKEILELKEGQKPFDYSQEALEIKALEDKITPLANRQINKKPMFDEYQNKIDSLYSSLNEIEEILNPVEEVIEVEDEDIVEDIENEDIEEVDVEQ